VLLLFCDY
jgi:hypothetical protein